MERQTHIDRIEKERLWDVLIIGGGAVGLGAALDAVSRGYSTVLLEQHDFCKGTSSRSTKLIHGGVRYLAQGNLALVRESLHERGLLLRNAPSLVTPLRFVVPCYGHAERLYYSLGMKFYDQLAGRLGIQASRRLSNAEVAAAIPGLDTTKLRGGVGYYDAQFDDAGLAISVAKKVSDLGGVPLNYVCVDRLILDQAKVRGAHARDQETWRVFDVRSKVVINATGGFSDDIRRMENPTSPSMISLSQGVHLVVENRFLGGNDALMIPKTKDGRVLFAIPWMGRVLLGTTDTPVEEGTLEPRPLDKEVDYLLDHFAHFLNPAPSRADVLSAFAGLRPLVKPATEASATSKISREHRIVVSHGGLVSILGGKWTTFRKMSEDVIDTAASATGLPPSMSRTNKLPLQMVRPARSSPYGPPTVAEIQSAARMEFARTVEDVLARRLRLLLLDARKSAEYAPDVARQLADVLHHSEEWADEQAREYGALVDQYTLNDPAV